MLHLPVSSLTTIAHFFSWLTLPNALSLATLVVLVYACRAAIRQAKAAVELTTATQKQIEVFQLQAEAAKEQQHLSRRQLEEALRPILLLDGPGGGAVPFFETTLKNDAIGPALDIKWFYGSLPEKATTNFDPTIIGAKEKKPFKYDSSRALADGICFTYRSLTGSKHATVISWQPGWMNTKYVPNID